MAEVVSTGVSHMCDNSTVSVKLIIILSKVVLVTAGHVILLETCGDGCVSVCQQLMAGLSMEEGSWYVSPTAEQGQKDTEAFENYTESSFSM